VLQRLLATGCLAQQRRSQSPHQGLQTPFRRERAAG